MSTWLPQDLPPDLEPAAESPGSAAPPPLSPTPEFRAAVWQEPPVQPTRGLGLNEPWSTRRIVLYCGLVALVVASVLTFIELRDTTIDYSPNYAGTPVEAADAADGLTVVGLDNAVAYRMQPGWVDIESYTGVIPEAAEIVQEGGFVGAHLTAPLSNVLPDVIMISGLDERAPQRSLAELQSLGIEQLIETRSGTIVSPSEPITTSTGLRGYEATVSVPTDSGPKLARLVVLGNGGHVVILQWLTANSTIDEAAFQELLNSVRIDA